MANPFNKPGKRPSVASMFGVREDIDNIRQVDNTIDHWAFDKEIYRDIYKRSQIIKDSVGKGEGILKPYPDLAEDVFYSLYKHRPFLRDEEEVTASHLFNRGLVEEMLESDDYNRLRQNTRFDTIASALGSELIHQQLYTKIEQARNEYLARKKAAQDAGQAFTEEDFFDKVNNLHDAEQLANSLAGQIAAGNGAGKGGQGGGSNTKAKKLTQAQKDALQKQFNAAAKALKDAQDAMKAQVAAHGNPMSGVIQGAMKKAADEVGEVSDFMGQWGLSGGDPNIRISYEDKKQALKRLRASDKLKKFAALIGRFKKLAIQEQKRKVPDGKAIIKDVTVGRDLEKVLPSELMLLGLPETEDLFYTKFLEGQLLQYEKDAVENIGKGPIIAMIDVSGSMSGTREEWSKATALALLEVANKQKRNFACCHFDTSVTYQAEIPYGNLKPQDIFDIAEKFAGGGTHFDPPIEWAMKIIQTSKFNKADIVFITDGDGGFSDKVRDEFLKLKKDKQFKLRTVLIDVGGDGSKHTVGQISDAIMNVSDMANLGDSHASNIFAAV